MKVAHPRTLWIAAEGAVTLGLVLLLFVAHQLWWTNRQAQEGAAREVAALERDWGKERGRERSATGESDAGPGPVPLAAPAPLASPSASPRPAEAYAVLVVPRLSLRVPVAEGVGRADVLDKGYAGHYPGTAQPGRPGNFALAGHRNTHGEPFRHLDRLEPGDEVRVETRDAVHTYVVDRTLPQTVPGDGGVLRSVPRSDVRPSYGYGERGHYLTLTTCTPEYTSTYRLVVWGKLRSVRLR
ncbi:class E sortase [Streptomyces europaeiscabiei]|uniref:class E sortase n=1 Tax=Streptomyces europaeiscabiei TaxID=146819 RepID=UPI0029A3DFB4|nr:class E sortase [Streptomyces europaeiscabiei]MDX3840106.1 class E sortase [Streptomyces europaeiscabiei]